MATLQELLNAQSAVADRNRAKDWSARNRAAFGGILDVNQYLPVTGDIQSGILAAQDLNEGAYGSAALNALGLLPFVPAMGGVVKKASDIPATKYVDNMIDYFDGQSNMRLTSKLNDSPVGFIDYSVYENIPKINMIEVYEPYRRKGYATGLLQELQKNYPDTEIDFGMLTNDGSSLYKSLKFNEIPNKQYMETQNKLKKIEKQINKLSLESDKMKLVSNPSSSQINKWMQISEKWNDLNDESKLLKESLEDLRPMKKIIK